MQLSLFINEGIIIPNVNFIYDNEDNAVDVYKDGIYITTIRPNEYRLELSHYHERINIYSYKIVRR